MNPIACLSLAVLALIGAGCSTATTHYPSLGPRAVEKQGFGEPEAVAATATPDPALDATLIKMVDRLDAIARGFEADATKAQAAGRAANGQPAGSERWIAAQVALATLDDWRAQSSSLVTDAEQLAIARAAGLAPEYPGIASFGDRAQAEADREGAMIARLQAALPPA